MTRSQRFAVASVAASAFWLGRAEADCAIRFYSVDLELASTTPPDPVWPGSLRLTQRDEKTIQWLTVGAGQAPLEIVAQR
jgi:hypothetical protein